MKNSIENASPLEAFVIFFLVIVGFFIIASILITSTIKFHKQLPPDVILPNHTRKDISYPVTNVDYSKVISEEFQNHERHLMEIIRKLKEELEKVKDNYIGLKNKLKDVETKIPDYPLPRPDTENLKTKIEQLQRNYRFIIEDNAVIKKSFEELSSQVVTITNRTRLELLVTALLNEMPPSLTDARVREIIQNMLPTLNTTPYPLTTAESVVSNALLTDLIGLPDRASAFGTIINSEFTPTEKKPRSIGNLLTPEKNLIKYGPSEIIKQRPPKLARCWPFKGPQASVEIKLACPVNIQNITLDHVLRRFCINTESAPKHFLVLGKYSKDPRGDTQVPVLLANATFGPELGIQTFLVNNPEMNLYDLVEVKFLENYGHWYTCVYRFRIHGDAEDDCLRKITT